MADRRKLAWVSFQTATQRSPSRWAGVMSWLRSAGGGDGPDARTAPQSDAVWARAARSTEGPDRLEAVEEALRQAIPHIGLAASIAEVYAQRMRSFLRAGNEPRAVAAFKLAVDWMGTYASWATSGGEGTALSEERDRFRAALARELGYDPTEIPPAPHT